MPFGAPLESDRVASVRKYLKIELKQKIRARKARYAAQNRLKALPRIKYVYVNANYANPVTLNKVPTGPTVYQVKDPKTGRLDYFDKATFWRLLRQHAPNIKNNYNLMMALPSRALFPNPLTRTGITTRNIQRVITRIKPTRSAAARKIQAAYRARKSH